MIGPSTLANVVPAPQSDTCGRFSENKELRRLTNDILDAKKYVLATVAAEPSAKYAQRSLQRSFATALLQRPEQLQNRYKEKARLLLDLDEAGRTMTFGRHGSTPPARVRELGAKAIGRGGDALTLNRKILGLPDDDGPFNIARLEATWGPIRVLPTRVPPVYRDYFGGSGAPDGDPDIAWPGYYRTSEFKIREIYCVDETNEPTEWMASDEILIGGTSIDPTGKVTKIEAKGPYEDFDDGDSEPFSPPMTFATFEYPAPKPGEWFTSHVSVFVTLCEEDEGSFGAFLNDLYAEIEDEVKAAINAGVTAATFEYLGPILSKAAGELAAWAVDELIEWFIDVFEDDIFKAVGHATMARPYPLALYVPPDWTYDGTGMVYKDQQLTFMNAGDTGGHYKVKYFWRESNWVAGAGYS